MNAQIEKSHSKEPIKLQNIFCQKIQGNLHNRNLHKKMYRKCLKFYLKLMNFIAPIVLLLSIMIPVILCYFSASNDYFFNDYQFSQS